MKHEVLGLLLKLWLICVIGFILFCIGRGFNHFPKHEDTVTQVFNQNI